VKSRSTRSARAGRAGIGAGGHHLLAAADTPQALLAHQPFHRAAGHVDALAAQQPPDLARAADPTALLAVEEDPLDVLDQLGSRTARADGGRVLAA
jgi:hypothetical protein